MLTETGSDGDISLRRRQIDRPRSFISQLAARCDADDEMVGFGPIRSPSNTKSARATWVPAMSTITSAVVVLSMTTSDACPS